MFTERKELIKAYKARDPAARSDLEIVLLYPGLRAVRRHRRANWCYRHRLFFLARAISQRTRRVTGIEIPPAAKIGRRLVIDHGMGVVIGETAEIGDDVLLYQGVTLGGTGKDQGKRHPTIGDNVLVGAGAKVLGPFKVGDNARIAANAVVLKEVPPDSTAVGVPARIVRLAGQRVNFAGEIDQVSVTDPVSIDIAALREQLEVLEQYLASRPCYTNEKGEYVCETV
ncbi:MAG: serine O-acetyltransferase [Firmicutes bacterium]|nr:serine O-acetyltransferase [Bacillota bacterium]